MRQDSGVLINFIAFLAWKSAGWPTITMSVIWSMASPAVKTVLFSSETRNATAQVLLHYRKTKMTPFDANTKSENLNCQYSSAFNTEDTSSFPELRTSDCHDAIEITAP